MWAATAGWRGRLMTQLAAAGFTVGDNEPYTGALEGDTLDIAWHEDRPAHVLIEMRQDFLIDRTRRENFAHAAEAGARRGACMGAMIGERRMDEKTRTELEAAVFRRLVAHLRERTDVQNIDLMILAGFCRNCLGDWYREAAAEKGIALEKDQARETGLWHAAGGMEEEIPEGATPEQQAAFDCVRKRPTASAIAPRCAPRAARG